ncbi:MAG: ABC transporter substrate-binding protein [Synergistaceae bacterium]|jgi:putative ABC transport system substrate-binding protein|nr:ABC transporter substrate-binding protein [Synergistaceae bacterium]
MKTIKNLSIILLAVFLISSCNQKSDQIRIGVIQYANQSILDSVYVGIQKKFNEYNEKYTIKYQVAHGDPILNATISKQLVKDSVNLIIALGTPSAQAVTNDTKTIPIVFSAITDPVGARLAATMNNPGGNKTGITNMQPFDKQIELIRLIKPNVKKVGIIINSSEANCVAGMVYVRKALEAFQIPYEEMNASSSVEIITSAQSLATRCDVFFISPSNTIYENLGALKKEAEKKGIMVLGGDQSAVLKYGSVGTYTYDFVEMGVNTAELAIKILDQKLNPGNIAVSRPANTYLYFNMESAKELGLTVPDSLLNKAVK